MESFSATLAPYRSAIESMIKPIGNFEPEAESGTTVQVERGEMWANALVSGQVDFPQAQRLVELSRWDRSMRMTVVDRSAHFRPVYRSLLVYSWLQTFKWAYEKLPGAEFGQWEEAIRAWCDALETSVNTIQWVGQSTPAALGSEAAEACWAALTLHLAGKVFVRDAWTDLASDAFGKLCARQHEAGSFLHAEPSDGNETTAYHEAMLIHAAADFAVQSEDRAVARAVARATARFQETFEPAHASNQPWALFALIWNQETRPTADQVLHTVQTQYPKGARGISLMLLCDALYCLRLFGI